MYASMQTAWRLRQMEQNTQRCTFWSSFFLVPFGGYGSGGAGLSVPRSRLKTDDGTHSGIASSFAARNPINSITLATVRGPVQSHSGRTMSVGW